MLPTVSNQSKNPEEIQKMNKQKCAKKFLDMLRATLGAICTLLMSAMTVFASTTAPALLKYGVVKPTIAGISSGGFMAVQMSVAYSKTFIGVAVFAGGPYYCAVGNVLVALTTCKKNFPAITDIGLGFLETSTNIWDVRGLIDSTSNMADQKVYLYSGKNDSVVVQPVMDALHSYYQVYTSTSNIAYNNASDAEHSWVTWKPANGKKWKGKGPNTTINNCVIHAPPFINNCGNDPEHDLINQLYGSVTAHSNSALGNMVTFDQSEFMPTGAAASDYSVDTTGYLYVPTYCATNSGCKVMVALHGCLQGYKKVGNAFITNNGLNEYADTNNLLVIYPQLIESPNIPFNPEGCWDFWGYTGLNYQLQGTLLPGFLPGVQPAMIKAMVDRVMRPHY